MLFYNGIKEQGIMPEGQTYNIPESRFNWFKDQLAKLDKRAKRIMGPNAKIYCTVLGFHFLNGEGHQKLQKMKIFEVFVSHPEVKLEGWQFVARIDHSQDIGNVVRVVPGQTLPARYRDSTPFCEHCNINRLRRDTFVLNYIRTQDCKQVGSSCLKDFVGHADAVKLAKLAELLAIIGDYSRGHGFERYVGFNDFRYISAEQYMSLVGTSIKTHGWISNKFASENAVTSTSNRAIEALHNHENASFEGRELAAKAIEWAQSLEEDGIELSDWEHNANVIAQSEALEMRHLGVAASIVGVYYARFEKNVGSKISSFIGNIKDKVKNLTVTVKVVASTDYSTRHVFEDAHGNILVWFASNENLSYLLNQQIVIDTTIKAHNQFNGRKQTIVNRVKIVS
jgi:hypothetical protein